jgi:hypothetical protein
MMLVNRAGTTSVWDIVRLSGGLFAGAVPNAGVSFCLLDRLQLCLQLGIIVEVDCDYFVVHRLVGK